MNLQQLKKANDESKAALIQHRAMTKYALAAHIQCSQFSAARIYKGYRPKVLTDEQMAIAHRWMEKRDRLWSKYMAGTIKALAEQEGMSKDMMRRMLSDEKPPAVLPADYVPGCVMEFARMRLPCSQPGKIGYY